VAVNGLNIFVDIEYLTGINTNDEDLIGFVNADKYELKATDYLTPESGAFLVSENEEMAIKDILTREISIPKENDIIRVEYLKYTEERVDGTKIVSETNFDTFQGWTPINIIGDQEWSEGGTRFMNVQMSGFNGSPVENEDWLISPKLDFSENSGLKIQIDQTYAFGDPNNLGLQVLISNDYSNDVATANWEEITFTNLPANDSNNIYVLSEFVDISKFDGQVVNIALKYESTDQASTRWRVRQIKVEAGGLDAPLEQLFSFFKYNGTEWEVIENENVYVVRDEDYDEMEGPARFKSFSNSVLPENYLPTFLEREFPFAQQEDNILVIYDFFYGGSTRTLTTATQYVFNDIWAAPSVTLKFTYKDGRWESNNATPYELVEADYDFIATELANEEGLDDEISNLDRFGNFNRREGGPTYWDNDELLQALNVILKQRFPESETGDLYELTISAFPTGTEIYVLELGENGDYIYVE
jgi:hypothetical protein